MLARDSGPYVPSIQVTYTGARVSPKGEEELRADSVGGGRTEISGGAGMHSAGAGSAFAPEKHQLKHQSRSLDGISKRPSRDPPPLEMAPIVVSRVESESERRNIEGKEGQEDRSEKGGKRRRGWMKHVVSW